MIHINHISFSYREWSMVWVTPYHFYRNWKRWIYFSITLLRLLIPSVQDRNCKKGRGRGYVTKSVSPHAKRAYIYSIPKRLYRLTCSSTLQIYNIHPRNYVTSFHIHDFHLRLAVNLIQRIWINMTLIFGFSN